MSAQCWCFTCAGRVVSRNTFAAHGRKERPDPPTRKRPLEMLSMDDASDAGLEASAELEPPSIDDVDLDDPWAYILEHMEGEIGQGKLTGAQVTLLLLDWCSSHKVSDTAVQSVWSLIKALLPEDADMPTWYSLKARLRKYEQTAVRRVEICPNDCVAYYDTVHLEGVHARKHAHRTKCPTCNAPRYVTDPKTGRTLPAKSFYHFPLQPYIRGLYARPDLCPHLLHDCGDYPEGHVTRSRGYRKKVTENPLMAADSRHIALVGTTDGVPFFDDQIRGCWPFFFRSVCPCLPFHV